MSGDLFGATSCQTCGTAGTATLCDQCKTERTAHGAVKARTRAATLAARLKGDPNPDLPSWVAELGGKCDICHRFICDCTTQKTTPPGEAGRGEPRGIIP